MMEKLKRWWWVVAIVVVAGALVLYMAFGRGGSSPAADNGQPGSSSGTGTSSANGGTQSANPGSPGSPSATGTPGGSTASVPVAAEGAKLATVTAIPKNTLARVKFSEARNNQTYDITFRVYGTGPSVGGHGGLVVQIISSAPQKATATPFNFRGMNVLLQLGPKVAVTKGGEYKGVMKLMSQSGGLVPVLTQAKAQ